MKDKILNPLTIFIQLLFFTQIFSYDCPKTQPIYIDGECKLTNCPDSYYESGICTIANNITKIQWYNNILKISDISYNYANPLVNINGDLFIGCTPLGNNQDDPLYKERAFFGLRENGRPLFYDSEKDTFVSMKKLYFDNNVYYKWESEMVNVRINDSTNYYFSPGKDNGYSEIYDFNDNKAYYTSLAPILGYKYTKIERYVFLRSEKGDKFIFAYVGYQQFDSNPYLFFHRIKFNSPIISPDIAGSYEQKQLENTRINELKMISCLETDNKYIECFIINNDYSPRHNVTIYQNSFDDDIFVRLNTSIFDNDKKVSSMDLFYKAIHLQKEVSVFLYFFNYDERNIYVQIRNLVVEKNQTSNKTLYYLENYLSFTDRIISQYYIDQYFNLNDLSKIHDTKFAHCAFDKNKDYFVIFIYELLNNAETVTIKVYKIDTKIRNIKLRYNLRFIHFTYYLGAVFSAHDYNSDQSQSYIHLMLFSYMNSTDGNFKDLLKNNSVYEFKLSEYVNSSTIENNIFGFELINIKIINISSNLNSENGLSVTTTKNNRALESNQILDLDDGIKIKVINENNGVHFGKYSIEFSGVIQETLTYKETLKYVDDVFMYGENLTNDEIEQYYDSKSFTGRHGMFNFTIETCYDTCSECGEILGYENNQHCTICNENFSYMYKNGEKCCDSCYNYGYYQYKKTCRDTCENDASLYIDQGSKICYDDCKENENTTKILTYKNLCVDSCYDYNYYEYNYHCYEKCGSNLFVDEEFKICYSDCKSNNRTNKTLTYKNQCLKSCFENGYYKYGDYCFDSCGTNLFIDEEYKICIDNCTTNNITNKKLTYNNKCLDSCFDNGLYRYGDICYDSCPDDLFSDEETKICYKDCKDNENTNKVLTYKKTCIESCYDNNYFKYGDICYDNCPEDLFVDEESKMCYENCKDNDDQTKILTYGKKCIASCYDNNLFKYGDICYDNCPEDLFVDEESKMCYEKCKDNDDQTKVLTYGKKCIASCSENNLYKYGDICYDVCNSNLFTDEESKNCFDNCKNNSINNNILTYKNKCIASCYDNNLFKFGDNCYDECASNLFIDEESKICYTNCKDNENTNKVLTYKKTCIASCFDNNYFRYGDICYDNCPSELFVDEESKICYEKCKDNENINKILTYKKTCIESCYDNNYFKYGDYCYDNCPNNLFADEESKLCYENCLDNDNKNKILTYNNICIESCFDNNYYKYLNNCYDFCPSDLYTDENSKDCYPSCQNNTNSSRIITFEKQCVSECPVDYEINYDTNFCESLKAACEDYYYINAENKKICISYEECKKNFSYIINGNQCQNDGVIYNGKYYTKCPEGTCLYLNSNSLNVCIDKKDNMLTVGNYCMKSNINIEEMTKNLTDKSISLELNDNSKINIYPNELNISNLDNDVTYINLGECQNKIISYYNLESSAKLYIMTLDMNKRNVNSSVNKCEYEIYLQNGTLVENIDKICGNNSITMSSPIANKEIIKYDIANNFKISFNYDIYDPQSEFYQDYCSTAHIDGNDIIINDRITDFYIDDVSFCNTGCVYNGTDFDTGRTICSCTKGSEENEVRENLTVEEDDNGNFFTYIKDETNYKVFYCSKLMKQFKKFISNNYGLYVSFACIIICIIDMIIVTVRATKRIKKQFFPDEDNIKNNKENKDTKDVFISKKNFESKKDENNMTNIDINNINKSNIIDSERNNKFENDKEIIGEVKPIILNINKKCTMAESLVENPAPPKKLGENQKQIENEDELVFGVINFDKNINNELNKENIFANKPKKKRRSIKNIPKNVDGETSQRLKDKIKTLSGTVNEMKYKDHSTFRNLLKGKTKNEEFEDVPCFDKNIDIMKKEDIMDNNHIFSLNNLIIGREETEDDLNDLPYTAALRFDKRNFLSVFLIIFLNKVEIIKMLFFRDDFEFLPISINIFLLDELLELFFNALFYSDDVISQKYHSDGKLEFITEQLLSLVSNIISYLVMKLFSKLIVYSEYFSLIEKEVKGKDKLIKAVDLGLKIMKRAMLIFSILNIAIFGLILFYLSIFCAMYPKSQASFFKDFGLGELQSLILSFAIAILVAFFRRLSLKYRSQRLYETSKFIDNFL